MEEHTDGQPTITIQGTAYEVRLPLSFAAREDIVTGWREAGQSASKSRRIFAATLAICVPRVAAACRPHTLDSCAGDIFLFGRLVYDALHDAGWKVTPAELSRAAATCYALVCADLFPRESEVADKEDFSDAGATPT